MNSSFLFRTSLFTLLFGLIFFVSCTDHDNKTETQATVDAKVGKLKLPAGFHAQRLYSSSEHNQGSWVSMAFDNKGRLIASDQYGSLYRVKLPVDKTDSVSVEKLWVMDKTGKKDTSGTISMGYAHGLLYAFNSLYVCVNHESDSAFGRASGLYRLQDTDGDDQYDKITLLKALKGEGEHGPHSVILSPDKKSLFVIAGNHTDVPQMNAYRLPSNWHEDNLFPLIKDPNGHANNRYAPGGWIANVDSSGNNWTLFGAGFRNAFDIAFNDAGDLFAYDSDMEWDFGMPWYRPTRLCHVTSGSEFGWRTGNSKWSPSYPDNLPALLNIGQGSPTNLIFGTTAKFPKKYRESLFAFDWSFGIIYSVHLQPEGASYKAQAEEFISGSPLPLTDGVFGPDGSLYFLTGGRRLDSDLYRVTYDENEQAEEKIEPVALTEEAQIRRKLETFHGAPKTDAVNFAWPYLNHADRFIRYAARIAIEHQPVAEWQEKAFNETDPIIKIQSFIAFARQGKPELQERMLQSLTSIDFQSLHEPQQIDLLRTFELIFSRMGMPKGATRTAAITYLDKQFPANTNNLNRSLSKLLVYLDAPDAVQKTMALMVTAKDDTTDQKTFTQSSDLILRNPQYGLDIAGMLSKVPPAQQTYYATVLSEAKSGWTSPMQDEYFKWFYNAFQYKGGVSFVGFIDKARKKALAHVDKNKFRYFNSLSGDSLVSKSGNSLVNRGIQPKGPGRDWELAEAVAVVDSATGTRSFEKGKAMFVASLCGSCHGMRGEGANIGPDLTQLGTRFSTKDMLEAIIEPSKSISDQYTATIFLLKGGNSVVGRLINQDNNKYYISQNPFAPQTLREIPKSEVTKTQHSDVSIMLPGLINRLSGEELKDLVAFLMSGGNKDHPVYKQK
jgi:putative heme-binding domain-containing protein